MLSAHLSSGTNEHILTVSGFTVGQTVGRASAPNLMNGMSRWSAVPPASFFTNCRQNLPLGSLRDSESPSALRKERRSDSHAQNSFRFRCIHTGFAFRFEHRKWYRGRNGLHQLGQPVAPSIQFPVFKSEGEPGTVIIGYSITHTLLRMA